MCDRHEPQESVGMGARPAQVGTSVRAIDDACWARLALIVPHPKPGGRPRGYTRRQFVEADAYVLKHGCGWRELPTIFPPWHTVYERVRTWRQAGVLEQIWAVLCGDSPTPNDGNAVAYAYD